MQFKHLTDELRELLKREFQEQVAAIDKELQALGIAPDEFDGAAPEVAVSVAPDLPTSRGSGALAFFFIALCPTARVAIPRPSYLRKRTPTAIALIDSLNCGE